MVKMTRKQLKKFDTDLLHAKNCEHTFSRINELVRLSFSLGDIELNSEVMTSLDRCYNDIYCAIHGFLPVGDEE